MSRRVSLLLLPLALAACAPEVGECNASEARRPAYDQATGLPAYEGQAILIQSCGSGGFCHADGGDAVIAYGAPNHLTFDLQLASIDGSMTSDAADRLRRSQFQALAHAESILSTIDRGTMPPGGSVGQEVRAAAPAYVGVDGAPLPSLGAADEAEAEGAREIVRNYLACGAPVVSQPVAPSDGGDPLIGYVESARDVRPLEATWDDIYDRLLGSNRCSSVLCHGAGNGSAAGLDLLGREAALQRLLTQRASTTGENAACGDSGLPLLVPGNPDGSLLYQKLAGTFACGEAMPLGGAPVAPASVDAIRQWILALEPDP